MVDETEAENTTPEPTPQNEEIQPELVVPEPIPKPEPEIETAQMAGNEPLAPDTPTSEPETKLEEIETLPEQTSIESTPDEPKPKPESSQPKAVPPEEKPKNLWQALLTKARLIIQIRKRKKLEKIMTLFSKKPQITNDEVEKLLHVSDSTATRYLSQLEKEGRIKQTGKTGKAVSYSKI